MLIKVQCNTCKQYFYREKKLVNRNLKLGHKFYCSKQCQNLSQITSIATVCGYCHKPITRNQSQLRRSKIHFCSASCRASYSNLGRVRNYNTGINVYRTKALNYYGSKCSVCGYCVELVLMVHHKDGNRKNNELDNLDVLCPTHHREYHCGIRHY